MLGQGGYQILDYREFTSDNYEKIYNLITTNKMYLIEHFKTDEVEEISLFLTAIKNENDITFLYNNKTQTLVYAKSGITNNLAQGGGSSESIFKLHIINGINDYAEVGFKIHITDDDIACLQDENTLNILQVKEAGGGFQTPLFIMYDRGNILITTIIDGTLVSGNVDMKEKTIILPEIQSIINNVLIDLGTISGTSGTLTGAYKKIDRAFKDKKSLYMYFSMGDGTFFVSPNIISISVAYLVYIFVNNQIMFLTITNSDVYTLVSSNIFFPTYDTLQVNGIESIPVNSSITTSINSLTDKNTTINSIKPSVAGVIVSAPYFDGGNYKVNIFNATQSEVSGLTLTIDYYTLTQD